MVVGGVDYGGWVVYVEVVVVEIWVVGEYGVVY